MPTQATRYGKSTWAGSDKPSLNHAGSARLWFRGTDTYGYVFAKSPVPAGRVVTSAVLRLFVATPSGWAGSTAVSVRPVTESWKAGRLTWDTKPVTGGTTVSATVTDPVLGTVVELDVTAALQAIAGGAANYGFRVSTSATSTRKVWGFDSEWPPVLEVTWTTVPTAPTDLRPSGGAVSVAKPVLQFSATDVTNLTDLAALQVQVDPTQPATGAAFDSGWVTSTVPQLDLSATSYAGLAAGASTSWRARVRDTSGAESGWSDWVTFSRAAKPTVTINNPAATPNDYADEATPPILWTVTGGTQTRWRVQILAGADRSRVLADSGVQAGTATSWTVPQGVLADGGAYAVEVRAWDAVVRVETPGDPAYAAATRAFSTRLDATVTAPANLTVTQVGTTPQVHLAWTRATAPDGWTILRDGRVIAADVDPDDTTTGGTAHGWTDWSAAPNRTHTWEVRAVVNGKTSTSATAARAFRAPGVWLMNEDLAVTVMLYDDTGDREGSHTVVDQVAQYTVLGSPKVVQITTGLGGLAGTLAGALEDVRGGDGTLAAEAALNRLRGHQDQVVRLVFADLNIPVVIRDVLVGPKRAGTAPGRLRKRVGFGYVQVDEFQAT